ncbi:acetyl/propionyl/methylcrotonyl-CoA carboxylase subunit alpha [Simiduia aestuariiviva]|uniref:Biotin carboxylase n=1 Tax=Simiduia aestuariiviva TaxID=1510459 RepID=A0A839URV4_9GAMM|nr:biotin carboxylase N-terminal domain-containing protein [Simiduia aestuariiviva]MBB3168127.1 acetyl/propionyl-CoA carboxylase alpha subunit [Simiduia aestuariiviva]
MTNRKIQRLLVANRGEIACRIFRTAKAMGMHTIAVFSDADANARHVKMAHECHRLGTSTATDSYLNIQAIVQAAKVSGADAVHPGYGFLSENHALAQALDQAGIIFIGPSSNAIELMGDKRRAKQFVARAGVPLLPGFSEENASNDQLINAAQEIGFPLMVKAAHGGGGRGMRLVLAAEQLAAAIDSARAEARNAFGSDALLIERALTQPRHIEIQIFSDQHGQCVYLGERDCSVQRRHQKVIEEAPAVDLPAPLRQAMGEAAVRIALSCDYVGAGTVEFLVEQEQFYFLEMNTRLQVEHPVTEAIYGVDLVQWQLQIAQGAPLPKTQQQLVPRGHAIEVRLYAEDPAQNFMPQIGRMALWQSLEQAHQRTDHMLFNGAEITQWYDPLLAKLIAWGESRDAAIQQLCNQIDATIALGVNHNLGFLRRICTHPGFTEAPPTTQFLITYDIARPSEAAMTQARAAACLYAFTRAQPNNKSHHALSQLSHAKQQRWLHNGAGFQATLDARQWCNGTLILHLNDEQALHLERCSYTDNQISFTLDHQCIHAFVGHNEHQIFVQLKSDHYTFERNKLITNADTASASGNLNAPMDGQVLAILCESGQVVNAGDTLLLLEAMKMELPIKATATGEATLMCQVGDQVRQGQCLVNIAPAPENCAAPSDHMQQTKTAFKSTVGK